MSKTLTYEQMMALFAEGRKESAELRADLRASALRSEKETAELRASISELRTELQASALRSEKEAAELHKELQASALRSEKEAAELRTELHKGISELHKELQASALRSEKEAAELRASISELRASSSEQRISISNLQINMEKTNAMMEKNNAKLEKNTAMMKENNHRIGRLTNKLGGMVEEIVIPGIVEKFNEKGFGFESVITNLEFFNDEKNKCLAEVDALLENGKVVIAVETKTDLQIKDVNEHAKRLEILRELPRFKGKKIYGALATAVSKRRSVNYALEQGFYVLQRPDTMGLQILDFPKGCRAKPY